MHQHQHPAEVVSAVQQSSVAQAIDAAPEALRGPLVTATLASIASALEVLLVAGASPARVAAACSGHQLVPGGDRRKTRQSGPGFRGGRFLDERKQRCEGCEASGLSGGAAANPPGHARLALAPAGRAGDGPVGRAEGRRRTPASRNSRTSPRPARSSGSVGVRPCRRACSRAARVMSRSSRCARSVRSGAGGTTIRQQPGTRRSPIRWASPRARCRSYRSQFSTTTVSVSRSPRRITGGVAERTRRRAWPGGKADALAVTGLEETSGMGWVSSRVGTPPLDRNAPCRRGS
jgi:hypothetical protein